MLEISESELVLGMGLWGYPVRDRGLAGGIPNYYIGAEHGGPRRGSAREGGLGGYKARKMCVSVVWEDEDVLTITIHKSE